MLFSTKKPSSALADLERFLNDMSSLLSSKDLDNVPQISALRQRLDTSLTGGRDALLEARDAAMQHARQATKAADNYAHDEPWRVVTGAVAVGLLIGYCLCRRN